MNKIVLLGTGCPSPSHIRYGPSTLISTESLKILIDAGSGVTQRLSEFGLAPSEIDIILITHLHSDHIVDLYQLYISGWHTGRAKPFKIVGPIGLKKFFDKTVEAYADELNLRVDWEKRPNHKGLDIEITEIDNEFIYEKTGIKIKSIEVQHQPVEPAYGYQVFVDDKKITYSGDTRYSINLEKASQDAEYLIHEVFVSLNFDNKRMTRDTLVNVKDYHSTPEDVGNLAQAANVKKLILNHFVPPVFDEESLKTEISKYYDGEVIVGNDLDEFVL
tara:strand:+ start:515 stop:1339 length:825 start_codon:yes stop_codon:yes gene_type:complete